MVEAIKSWPEWSKYVIAAIATSALWVGFGEVSAITSISGKRLDQIDVRLSLFNDRITALSDKVSIVTADAAVVNVRQGEQLVAQERRIAELERGRDTNRENIARIDNRATGFDARIAEAERQINDVRSEMQKHSNSDDQQFRRWKPPPQSPGPP